MAAYMIVFAKIHDRDEFISGYGVPTETLIGQYGGVYLVRAPGVETLEGGLFDGDSAVISKWPDKAAIKAFWNSEAYRVLRDARQEWAEAHVMIVEGGE